jgi:hypothetical protein
VNDKLYILSEDGQTPVPAENEEDYIRWLETDPSIRRVALTTLADQCVVSTVFLGDGSGNWETMIFLPHSWQEKDMYRCTGSREQAEAMHERMVNKYKYGDLLPET